MFDSVAPWVQLGFAIATAVYLLVWFIPRRDDKADAAAAVRDAQFITELDKQAARCERQNEALLDAHRESTKNIVETQKLIRDKLHTLANATTIAVEAMRRDERDRGSKG